MLAGINAVVAKMLFEPSEVGRLRFHRDEVHWWRTRLAPALAFVSQLAVVWLLFANIGFLGAANYSYAYWLGPIDLAVVLGGIAFAFYLKRRDPARYERAGRLITDGL